MFLFQVEEVRGSRHGDQNIDKRGKRGRSRTDVYTAW
jgi:hypothetical protein